ncbi:DGQHR domain-containing protein [Rhizobium sp. SG741]|uniref:DGQHR domain-containing protein n=1 Tax=Rhizobium sp. SG741 TaxID=2587114 RepID=UPI0014462E2C|nr:DGQHR domain-containing protein [Rhizobium sp. SG741]NKJ03084.1 DGQHR domain-containing protein [Rhizobium sp. SG741]
MSTPKKPNKNKPKKSAEEKKQERIQRDHETLVRGAFRNAGFVSVPAASNKNFTFEGSTTDIDEVFVFENIIVLCEYTISRPDDISTHLKKKKIPYDKILDNITGFISFFSDKYAAFKAALGNKYSIYQYRLVIVYCSLRGVRSETKSEVPRLKYFDYNVAHYFSIVSKSMRRSARFELFDFLGLTSKDVADGVLTSKQGTSTYPGSILPESHSNFGSDFKVVSFYVDPQALLERCYVLRKYGWREGGAVYQRMISPSKIASVRKYLRDQRRVFINNIVVTLPDDTRLLDPDDYTIDPKTIQDTQPGKIQIPDRFNTIGIIDGQHRVFSYHEGGAFDDDISVLRAQQNLLVTGVVFPKGMSEGDRLKFEAKLFLEINSNQTNARSDLKQEISLVINPFSPESIAKRVVNYLNDKHGPLTDHFERYFFEKEKLKTTSVVSFAIKPLTNPQTKQSLFQLWNDERKERMLEEENHEALNAYVAFCASEVSKIFSAVKENLSKERWSADRKLPDSFLTTANVNGLLSCLRRLVVAGELYEFEDYKKHFSDIATFAFGSFRSSQYNRMGGKLYELYFAKTSNIPTN